MKEHISKAQIVCLLWGQHNAVPVAPCGNNRCYGPPVEKQQLSKRPIGFPATTMPAELSS